MALPPAIRRPLEFFGVLDAVPVPDRLPPSREGSPESDAAEPTLGDMISRGGDGSWLPDSWLDALADGEDEILNRSGGEGLKLYDQLLDDDVAYSSLQQRRQAITSRDWVVDPGDDKDPRSVKAADDFRDMLNLIDMDRVTGGFHYGVWYGYAIGEGMFSVKVHNGRAIIWLDDIVIPNRRHFGFTNRGELRITSTLGSGLTGEVLPDNKFVAIRTGGTHDFAFYGLGLAHWVYWPIFFKRAALKFWALYLENFGQPTVAVEFTTGEKDDPIAKAALKKAAGGVGRDRVVLLPDGTLKNERLKLIEAERSGAGASSYDKFYTAQDEAIMRVVLGQPGTSKGVSSGLNSNQADVHADVKGEIVKADSDLISSGGFAPFARWLTRWNYGEDVKPPRVYRVLDDAEDINTVAERDSTLDALGWQRTEESFGEVYGEGYERKPEPEPPVIAPGMGAPGMPAANDNRARIKRAKLAFDVDDAAPLYVSRKLLPASARKLIAWAKENGIASPVPAEDLHVTILYSKTPVDWFDMGEDWGIGDKMSVGMGGPRALKRFGDGAVVLRFASPMLKYRHETMIERGASSDYPEYKPHVTLSYDVPADFDLDAIEPFVGELEFGPEIFERIVERQTDPAALDFGAAEEEAIDRLARAMLDGSNPIFAAMAETCRDAMQGVTTVEGMRVALLDATERFPIKRLAELVALPLLAERSAAFVGAEAEVEA